MSDKVQILHGIPASPGIGIGKAFLYQAVSPPVVRRRVASHLAAGEADRFLNALQMVSDEIRRTRHLVEAEHGDDLAQIFDAQLAMLEDENVKDRTIEIIRAEHLAAEPAFVQNMRSLRAVFEDSDNEYLRARAADVRDIEHQVLLRLLGGGLHGLHSLRSNTIVVARDLLPSESVRLGRKLVKGLVLDQGGATYHAVIIARSLGLPSVVGTEVASRSIRSGDPLVVDGDEGSVHIFPKGERLRYFQSELRRQHRRERNLRARRDLPAMTRDGTEIALMANVDLQQEVDVALENGAAGVGMFRTEFLFMDNRPPTEEEQLEIYRGAVEAMAPRPVVIRTFDLGGDKLSGSIEPVAEPNPFLGWRGIRLCLDNPEFFKVQLRALLRAAAGADLRILIPMITTLNELRRTKELIGQAARELRERRLDHSADCRVGIMVEVPSTAITIDRFVPEVDFLSLGTNDLVQYTLAVDRTTPKVSDLYDHYDPAVLRLIRDVADSGRRHGVATSICGEMAGDPLAAILLLGLGVETLSVSPGLIPELKEAVRSIAIARARQIAAHCLTLESGADVRICLEEEFSDSVLPRRRKPRFEV